MSDYKKELITTVYPENPEIRVADDPLHKDARAVIERLRAELAAHRKYLESITDNGSDYPETMDELIDLGLVVEAPPTQDFIDEWGDDCEMYVLAWSPLARRALDGEE